MSSKQAKQNRVNEASDNLRRLIEPGEWTLFAVSHGVTRSGNYRLSLVIICHPTGNKMPVTFDVTRAVSDVLGLRMAGDWLISQTNAWSLIPRLSIALYGEDAPRIRFSTL